MGRPKTPEGLGERGLSFWRRAHRGYDFSASETEILTEVCRCLDELERMAADSAAGPGDRPHDAGQAAGAARLAG